jgi:hypothetical protein
VTKKAKKARPHADLAASEDGDILVTMRVADCKHPVRGSVTRTCALCDAAVYVSPSSFATFVGRALPPIWCAQCALAFARRGGTA